MKLTMTRTAALLVLALGLSACGGKASFDVAGTISGLKYDGLVLSNSSNGDTFAAKKTDTSFKMPKSIDYGTAYDVKITTQPANQTCDLVRGTDTAGRLATISIPVSCSTHRYLIGGKVTGLTVPATGTKSGLVVANGADQLAIEANGDYRMGASVAFDETYGVAILTQPTGQKCVVSNPSGTVKTVTVHNSVGDSFVGLVENIDITCT